MFLVKSWQTLVFGTAIHIHGEKEQYLQSKLHVSDMWLLSSDKDELGQAKGF